MAINALKSRIKATIKQLLKKCGVKINLISNLWYLDPFVILKKAHKLESPLVIDAGAGDGSTLIQFKKLFPASTVYSFEPFPNSFEKLEQVALCHKNVSCTQTALSNKAGKHVFHVNRLKAANSLLKSKPTNSFIDDHTVSEALIVIEATTVDAFVYRKKIPHIDILKMDVQGGELLVLEGAKETLRRKGITWIYTEIWFLEAYADQPLYHDIAHFLAGFGYLPFGIYNMHYRKDGHFLWGDAIFYIK